MSSQPKLLPRPGFPAMVPRLFIGVSLVFLACLALMSILLSNAFEARLVPAIEANIQAVGDIVARDIQRAVTHGVPISELQGMNDYLGSILTAQPDLSYLAVWDRSGARLYGTEPASEGPTHATQYLIETRVPIFLDGDEIGSVHVGVTEAVAFAPLSDLVYDVGSILVVTFVGTFEILLVIIVIVVFRPFREISHAYRQFANKDYSVRLRLQESNEIGQFAKISNTIVDRLRLRQASPMGSEATVSADTPGASDFFLLRVVLILFVLSEEITRSFLPLYVETLGLPEIGFSQELMIGLPISVFMIVVGIGTVVSGSMFRRFGFRNLFTLACVLSASGFLGILLVPHYGEFLFFRCLTALGYAIGTLAVQVLIARAPSDEDRLQGMSGFVAAIMTAAIVGSTVGGMLAEQFGYRVAFGVASAMALLALVLSFRWVHNSDSDTRAKERNRSSIRELGGLFRDTNFATIAIAIIMPTKAVLAGVLFFTIPLHLSDIGFSPSDIGRVMLLYFLTMILSSNLSTRLFPSSTQPNRVILIGTLVGCLGPVAIYLDADLLGTIACAFLMALGSGFAAPHVITFALDRAGHEARRDSAETLAAIRLLERLGSAVGPAFVGALTVFAGLTGAVGALGLVCAGLSGLFLARFGMNRT